MPTSQIEIWGTQISDEGRCGPPAAVIVWRGELSDTNILQLQTINCKFEFDVRETPSLRGQKFLLAALESPVPGTGTFRVN
jgi:hypothetical protein